MPLTLAELFPAGFRWRRWVLEEAARQLRARQASGESRFWPGLESAAWPAASIRSGFFLTEEGPSVFFPLYALGPYVEGIPTFSAPPPPRKRKRRFPPNFRACLKHVNMPNRRAFCLPGRRNFFLEIRQEFLRKNCLPAAQNPSPLDTSPIFKQSLAIFLQIFSCHFPQKTRYNNVC